MNSARLILVCGSRDWTERSLVRIELAQHLPTHPAGDEPTIMHGNAKGADRIAAEIALQLGFWVEPHYADWEAHGKRAGILRNIEMLDRGPDLVLAFQKNHSRGTEHTVTEAKKRGIPLVHYHVEDDYTAVSIERSTPTQGASHAPF